MTPAEERLEDERQRFVEMIRTGVPQVEAAVAVGWTRQRLKTQMRDPVFAELLEVATRIRDGAVVKVAYNKAIGGDKDMIKFWLTNRVPDEWAERRQVDISGSVQVPVHVTIGVRDGLRELLSAEPGMVKALAVGGPLDQIEEAEVISDSVDDA